MFVCLYVILSLLADKRTYISFVRNLQFPVFHPNLLTHDAAVVSDCDCSMSTDRVSPEASGVIGCL